jgi:hypothetical protein
MTRVIAFVLSIALLVGAVALGLALIASSDGPRPDETSLGGLSPLFDPETGFASQTSNCPGGPGQAGRDPDAEALTELVPDALEAAKTVRDDAVPRSAALDWQRDTATFYFSSERGGPPVIYVSVQRPFAKGASQRIEVKTDNRIGIPDSVQQLELENLKVGPSAAIDLLKARADSLDSVAVLMLSYEGCHLVWAIVGLDAARQPVLGRVNNTTGELLLEPPPAQ